MRNKCKVVWTLAVLAAIIGSLAACSGRKAAAGQVRVVLDWTPNTNHTGL